MLLFDNVAVRRERSPHEAVAESSRGVSRREQRRAEARRRAALKPLRDQAERLERLLQSARDARDEVERALAEPALYETPGNERLLELIRRQAGLVRDIGELEERWLEVNERIEQQRADQSGVR